jgi:hypothetical protein
MLTRKRVFINDSLIGEAATWEEVRALLKERGIFFIGAPRGAEGPTGFFLTAKPSEGRPRQTGPF